MARGLILALSLSFALSASAAEAPVADFPQAVRWLEARSRQLVRDARRPMKSGIAAFPPQAGPGYEAFWLRDYAYVLEGCSDALSDAELRDALLLFVDGLAPDGSGVDCVRFDGRPVYKPGMGTMGANPVADGGPFTVAVAWHTHRRLKDRELLGRVIDRLVKTMDAVPRNPKTGLVHVKPSGPGEPWDRCAYGFTDTTRHEGDVLFCSLLMVEANQRLADLLAEGGRAADAAKRRAEADAIAKAVRETFWDDQLGLFRSATVKNREPDLWGSAFAVYLGVVTDAQAQRIARYLVDHHAQVVARGQLRHLPAGVYWEAGCPRDTYQNGGHWATPVGWLICTLDLVDPKLAERTLVDLVRDFQQHGVNEWTLGPKSAVPNYLASATMPLAGAKELLRRGEARAR